MARYIDPQSPEGQERLSATAGLPRESFLLSSFDRARRALIESQISKGKRPKEIGDALQRWQAQWTANREADVQKAQQTIESQPGPIRQLEGLGAGAISYLNRGTFGAVPSLVGAVSPAAQGALETGLAAAGKEFPIATTVGDVGSYFGPTPLGKLTGLAGRVAASPFARVAASDLVKTVIGRSAAQLGSGLMGAGAAITVGKFADLEDTKDAMERVRAAGESITSVTNLGLVGATSLGLGLLRVRQDRAIQTALRAAEQLAPGLKVTPDVYRPASGLSFLFSNIASLPGGKAIADKFKEEGIWGPIRQGIQTLRSRYASRVSLQTAAKGIEAIVGAPGEGRIERLRQGIQGRAFAAEGPLNLSRSLQDAVDDGIGAGMAALSPQIRATLSQNMKSAMQGFTSTLVEANKKGRTVTFQDLEDFRQILVRASKLASDNREVLSEGDHRAASIIYQAISQAYYAEAPKIAGAFESAKFLYGLQELLPKASQIEGADPEKLVNSFFAGNKVIGGWKTLERFATKEELQKLRGWYFARFLQNVTPNDPTKAIFNASSWRNKLGGTQMFRQEVFDTVLPGLRTKLEPLVAVSERIQRGIGRGEGAQTGGRLISAIVGFSPIVAAASVLRDPSNLSTWAVGLLGTAGLRAFTKSLIQGRVAGGLKALSTGVPVTGPTQAAAAFQATPGVQAANQIGSTVLGALGGQIQ